jgi:hypothetical protein
MNTSQQPSEGQKKPQPHLMGGTKENFKWRKDTTFDSSEPLNPEEFKNEKGEVLKSLRFYIKESLALGLSQDEARKRAAAKRTLIMQKNEEKRVQALPLNKDRLTKKFQEANFMLEQIKTMNLEGVTAVYTNPEWQINDENYERMLKVKKLILKSRTPKEMKELFDKLSFEDQDLFDRARVREAAEIREIELKVDEHFERITTPEVIPVERVEVPVEKKNQAAG